MKKRPWLKVGNSETLIWSRSTQLNIKKEIAAFFACPPTKDNTDASRLASVIPAKILQAKCHKCFDCDNYGKSWADEHKIPHIRFDHYDH